jgi:hypothetical protein
VLGPCSSSNLNVSAAGCHRVPRVPGPLCPPRGRRTGGDNFFLLALRNDPAYERIVVSKEPSNYVHQDYPAVRYHESQGQRTVKNSQEERALGRGWVDTPAKFNTGFWPRLIHLAQRFKTYEKMGDEQLERYALRFGIGAGTSQDGYDREYAIRRLRERDTAIRVWWSFILSVVALLISIAAYFRAL